MIRSATFQLTLWYLAIIMALSIVFSVVLYQISSQNISAGLRRQEVYFGHINAIPPPWDFDAVRQQEADRENGRLQWNLFLFNLATLLIGGGASFALARRTLRPIEDALESQSRFTSDASHELRTPLTVMQTEIEVALRKTSLSKDETKALLESNLEEISNLKKLSEGLLRLAQHNGKEGVDGTASLERVVAEALKRSAAPAAAKHIVLNNAAGEANIRGDEQSLTELLVILLDNAIKYSAPKTSVMLASKTQGNSVSLSVTDHGHGIKATDVPHVFDRFFRADISRSKEKVEGYGLGLSIAQKIVSVHGGSIDVKSTPGKGSTFTVRLPLQKTEKPVVQA